jgi:protein-disulfide isomerase
MAGAQSGNRKALLIVAGVLAVVVLAAISFVYFKKDPSTTASGGTSATYTTSVQGAVVIAGKSAPTTVDVYEDFLCPICGRFESNYHADIATAIEDGKIQVKFHPVAILNRATTPTGYSTRAANAVLCAAESGQFQAFHDKLFAEQPEEKSAGLTNDELIAKGKEVGVNDRYAQCVTSGKHSKSVDAATVAASKDTSLQADGKGGFGTPTLLVNGKFVDWRDDSWLSSIK